MQKEKRWLLKEKYNNKPTKQFSKGIERLKAGEPLDYVIGFTEFLGCKIDLSKKPLIPRPETEFWVGKMIKNLKIEKLEIRCLDMFSGSGCIGIAVLKHKKSLLCDISDSDSIMISQIKINLNKNFIKPSRSRVIKSDIFNNIKGKYDYIFANPPYIPTKNKNMVQKSVLKYEPSRALFGGGDGLFYIRKFLKQAIGHLNKNGRIYMEFSPEQKKEIEKILTRLNFSQKNLGGQEYKTWKFNRDQYGK